MANVTRRRTGEFLRNLFGILLQHADGMTEKDVLATSGNVVKLTKLSDDAQHRLPLKPIHFLAPEGQ